MFARIPWKNWQIPRKFAEPGLAIGSLVVLIVGILTRNYLAGATALACFALIVHRWYTRRMVVATGVQSPVFTPVVPATRRPARSLLEPELNGPKTSATLINEMIFQGRYAVLLRPEVAKNLSAEQRKEVFRVLREEMAEVKAGRVLLLDGHTGLNSEASCLRDVDHLFMDRFTVSNAEFQEFVDAGGYNKPELWDEAIRDSLTSFTDRSQRLGPRFWRNGKFLPGTAEQPVVGVSWYEADAFSRWTGKRLPADAEWIKTAISPRASVVSSEQLTRFPWGNAFREDRANLWSSGKGQSVAVAEYPGGQSAEGVHQMIGNVWEWMADPLSNAFRRGELAGPAAQFKSLRGGAFDTYVESQAACNATSGDSPLARRDNIGFRCALSVSDLADVAAPDV